MTATATPIERVFSLAEEAIEKREAHDENCRSDRSALRHARLSVVSPTFGEMPTRGHGGGAPGVVRAEAEKMAELLKKQAGKTLRLACYESANDAFRRKMHLGRMGFKAVTRHEFGKGYALYGSCPVVK